MILFSYILSILGWIFVVIGIVVFIKRKSKTNLMYPVNGFVFAEVFAACFSTLMFWFLKEKEQVDDALMSFFVLLGIIAILSYIHQAIQYDDTGFWMRDFLWRKKRYEYKDVQYIKRKTVKYKKPRGTEKRTTIFMEKRKIKIEQEYVNYFEFMEKMAKSYKEFHNKKIPRGN